MSYIHQLKYSPLGRVARKAWHTSRGLLGVQDQSAQARQFWNNLKTLIAEDPVVDLPQFAGKFQVAARSHLFLRLLELGQYENDILAVVEQYIHRDRDAIDIGANIGFFTCYLAKNLQKGRVLAVEPTPGAHRRLKANIARNSIGDKVIVYNGALSNFNGNMDLSYVEDCEEYSSLGGITHPAISTNDQQLTVSVPVSTLDSLVSQYNLQPGFIKIDVEGAEGFVFEGATETLRKHRPIIVSELSDGLLRDKGYVAKDIIQNLKQLGYKVTDPIFPNIPAGTREFGDILAIPE